MSKTKTADPFATIRETMIDAAAAAKAQADEFTKQAQAEAEKARATAEQTLETAIESGRENFETTVVVAKTVTDGLTKAGDMIHARVVDIAETQATTVAKVFSATTPAEVAELQMALFRAEQEKALAFANEAAALYKSVAAEMFKPIQARATKAVEQAMTFKAA